MARNWEYRSNKTTDAFLDEEYMIRIACAQYEIEHLQDWYAYQAKIEQIVHDAKEQDINLLVLPEYAGIECVCERFSTDEALYAALQQYIPQYIDFFSQIAKRFKMYLQPGTIIEQVAENQYVNRAYLFSPHGRYGFQDKCQLTPFEKSLGILVPSSHQTVFHTELGEIAIAICYDSEFPEVVSNFTQHGAKLILVPSYTGSVAGYNRVFLSCRARAIENQCFVAASFCIKQVNLFRDPEQTFGQAAILAPADRLFPYDGVLAQGNWQTPQILSTVLRFDDLQIVRESGEVLNFKDRLLASSHPPLPLEVLAC
jgi:predicted amidohydrolase